jgi:NADH dehydrogenase
MKILILGASGQIGHHVHEDLTARFPAASVVGSHRSYRLTNGQQVEKLESIHFDPLIDLWDDLGTYDVIINAIGQIRESKSSSFEQVHIELVQNFLAYATQLGNPLFVQISALGAGEHPDLKFLSTKAQADHLLIANYKKSVILRPSIVASPGTMLAQRMKTLLQMAKASMGILPVPKGFLNTQVQPILISDLCEGIGNLCEGKEIPDQIINLVGPSPIPFQEILEIGAAVAGRSLKYIEIPRPVIEPSVRYFVAPMLPGILTYEQFQLLFIDNIADVSMTEKLLGRMPESSIPFWQKELGT